MAVLGRASGVFAIAALLTSGCYRSHLLDRDAGSEPPSLLDGSLEDADAGWNTGDAMVGIDGSRTSCPSDIAGTWFMTNLRTGHTWTIEMRESGFPTYTAEPPCAGRWCNPDNCIASPPTPPACETVTAARLACASSREDYWTSTTYRFESSTRMTVIFDPGGGLLEPEVWEGRR